MCKLSDGRVSRTRRVQDGQTQLPPAGSHLGSTAFIRGPLKGIHVSLQLTCTSSNPVALGCCASVIENL